MHRTLTPPALALGALIALLACGPANAADRAMAPPHELHVTTADFHFRAARSVPAGLTRITLHNAGPQPHHVQLVKLDPGHTVAEFVERIRARQFLVPWATYVGGPESPPSNGTAQATLMLTAGEYAMVCFISGADHVPHIAKGMVLPLTVTESKPLAYEAPKADVRVTLREYAFDIEPEITAGRRTLRIENSGSQPHHVALVRLGPGRSVADALAWFKEMKGVPPDEGIGGTTVLGPGVVNYVAADFVPGEYALICFVPDAKDGVSHARHGMVRQIRVR